MQTRMKWIISFLTVLSITLAGSNLSVARAQSQLYETATLAAGTYNEDFPGIAYSSKWVTELVASASNGSQKRTEVYGEKASFTFSGNRLIIIYTKTKDSGVFRITIDGTDHKVNAYRANTEYQVRWKSPELTNGLHTVVIQKQKRDQKPILLDGLIIRGSGSAPVNVPGQPTAFGPTQTFTQAPTTAPMNTSTQFPTITFTPSATSTLMPSDATQVPANTSTPIPTIAFTPTTTWTFVPTQTYTIIPTNTVTKMPVASFTSTATITSVPTSTPTQISIRTFTPNPTSTPTLASTLTPTPTLAAAVVVSSGESIQTNCVNAVSAGSTCEVRSGTYAERVTIGKPLTLVCTGTCVVTGGIDVTTDHITVRGFEFTSRGITAKGQYNVIENNYIHDLTSEIGILLNDGLNTHHITIKNNTIVRANNACILIVGNNNLMEGNNCSNTKQPQTTSGDADCFRYFGGNHVLRSNYCHDIWYGPTGYNPSIGDYVGDTAHIDCFQTWNVGDRGGAGHDTLFEKNFCDLPDAEGQVTAKAFQTTGLTASRTIDMTTDYPCRNLTFKNNVVHSNFLAIFNYCQNITLLNNTFVGDLDASALGLQLQNLKGTNTIQYNIFVDQDNQAFTLYSGDATTIVIGGHNLIYRSSGVPVGSPQPGDLWDIDPQFVNPSVKDYHLKPGSPACGMGAFPCQ